MKITGKRAYMDVEHNGRIAHFGGELCVNGFDAFPSSMKWTFPKTDENITEWERKWLMNEILKWNSMRRFKITFLEDNGKEIKKKSFKMKYKKDMSMMEVFINAFIHQRIFSDPKLHEFVHTKSENEVQAKILYDKIQEVRQNADTLILQVKRNELRIGKAKRKLHKEYPYLTDELIDILCDCNEFVLR